MSDDAAPLSTPASAPAGAVENSLAATTPPPEPEVVTIDGPIICGGHSRPVPHVSYSRLIGSVRVSEDGAEEEEDERFYLVSACLDGVPMLRVGETGDWIGSFEGHEGAVWSAELDVRTATRCVTASADWTVKLWDAVRGDLLHSFEETRCVVKCAQFSRDGRQVLSANRKRQLRVYDLGDKLGEGVQVLDDKLPGVLTRLIPVPGTEHAWVTVSEATGAELWDLRVGKAVRVLHAHANNASLSPDESTIALSVGKERKVQLWAVDAAAGGVGAAPTNEIATEVPITCVGVDSANDRLVTGSEVELWARTYRISTGEETGVLKGHHGPVRSLAVPPRGGMFASGSEDGTIRLFDWPSEDDPSST